MTKQDSTGAAALSMDFDALYQGRGVNAGIDGVEFDVIPWKLDGPQPIIVELEAAGEIVGPVLECGCGLGDNALFLAEKGYQVTAFDAAATAIEQDRAKAAERGVAVDFTVADATTLDGISGGFRTVVDSAMLHCLDEQQRRAYLSALLRVCEPGARLHILCFTQAAANIWPISGLLNESNLRAAFADGWRIERMEQRRYTAGLTRERWREQMPAVLTAAFPPDLDAADSVDEQGRVLLPVWQITAERV